MNEKKLDFLIKSNFVFYVSIDGTKSIHDIQRPTTTKNSSYDNVTKSVKKIVKAGCGVKARTTVTKYSVNNLSEFVEHFNSLGIKIIHFEPFNPLGRGSNKTFLQPSPKDYISNFIKALDTAKSYGIKLIDSSLFFLLNPTKQFCFSAAKNRLIITPEGKVSFCLTIQNEYNPLSKLFLIGKYNREKDIFEYEKLKIKKLSKSFIDKNKSCKSCFAKYMCCGGCPVHNLMNTNTLFGVDKYFCEIRKALIKESILRIWKDSMEKVII